MDDLSRALEDDLIVAAPGGRCKQQDDEPSAEAHGADYTQTFRLVARFEGAHRKHKNSRRVSPTAEFGGAVTYSAAISSASPSERSISRARSASSYSFE